MNTITLLTGDKPSGKSFPEKPTLWSYYHKYSVLKINSLQDIKEIIEGNRGNAYNVLIRGIPHKVEPNGQYLRRSNNTTDTLLNWICLDIDGLEKDKPLKEKLIELLPFIKKETGMLIDYSSKEGVYYDNDTPNSSVAGVYGN